MKKPAKTAKSRSAGSSSSTAELGALKPRRIRRGRTGGNGGLGLPRYWHRKEYDAAHRRAEDYADIAVDGHATHVRARMIRCGKRCTKCPHGVYFYQCWRGDDGRQHEKYLGKWYPRGHGFVRPARPARTR